MRLESYAKHKKMPIIVSGKVCVEKLVAIQCSAIPVVSALIL